MPVLLSPYAIYQHNTTGKKLVKAALRKLGVIESGQELNGNELADALEEINRMLDNWNTEKLLVHVLNRGARTITAATSTLEIGPGGNLDQIRPQKIEPGQAFMKQGNIEYPVDVWLLNRWTSIRDKTITGRPYILYYEANHPLGKIFLYPVTDQSYGFILYSWNLLGQISNINQAMAFPPGYADAIMYELAIRLAPEYGKTVPAVVAVAAVQTKANVKRINMKTPELRVDPALVPQGGYWNIHGAWE